MLLLSFTWLLLWWGIRLNAGSRSFLVATSSLLLHAAHLTGLHDGSGRELDVLFRRNTDHEGGDVNHLLTNSDVLLSDEDTGVVHRVSELTLHHEGLETTFHELSDSQTQDVIELAFSFFEETEANHTADKGITYISLSYNHIYYALTYLRKFCGGPSRAW